MQRFAMDLHIHSKLSPCGGDDMTPLNIIMKAKEVGLNALVISDHNTAENQEAFLKCGELLEINILPGIEVQTKEDVHVLCIFDTLEQVLKMQGIIYEKLPAMENKKEIFGSQEIVDWKGNVIGENDRLLLTGTNISVDEITRIVKKIGGLAVPAHIDRPAYSLWVNLGFIPENLGFIGVELTPHLPRKPEQIEFIRTKGLGVLISSDSHYLDQIKEPYTFGLMEKFSVEELTLALTKQKGRYLTYTKKSDPFFVK